MSHGLLYRVGELRRRRAPRAGRAMSGRATRTRRLLGERLEARHLLTLGLSAPMSFFVDAGPDLTADEGSVVTGVGSVSDVGSQNWSATVNYGDGSGTAPLAINADRTFQWSHVFADNGRFPVTVTVSINGDEPLVAVDTVEVVVHNVAPSLFVCGRRTVPEGSLLSIQDMGMFTDPGFTWAAGGTAETFRYSIDWGDGSALDTGDATVDIPGGPGRLTRGTFDGAHTYVDDGQYTVLLTVRDDDDGVSAARWVTVVVTNAPPVITGATLDKNVIFESESVVLTGTFTDAGAHDTHTAVVDWGDGQVSNAVIDPAARTFTATHQYVGSPATTPPRYPIRVTVQDNGGATDTETLLVTVNPAPPVVHAGPDQAASEGQSVAFSGSFTDPSVNDTHTFLWDFGDGTTDTTSLTPTHVYADNGTYTVTLTVTDSTRLSASDTLTVVVSNVSPTLTVPAAQTVAEGALLSLPQIGQFTDPGFTRASAGIHETFTYSIDWGDGTAVNTGSVTAVEQGSAGVLTSGSFDGSHTYADNGTYSVTVTVADDDGGTASASLQVVVTNVAPTLRVIGNQSAIVGQPLSLTNIGTFTDPGFDNALNPGPEKTETFTYSINWGDGSPASTGSAGIDQAGSPGVLTTGSFDGSHTYASEGTFQVIVRVTDDDGGFDEQSFDVVVAAEAEPEGRGGDELLDRRSASAGGSDAEPPASVAAAAATDGARPRAAENEAPTVWGPGNLAIEEGPFSASPLAQFLDMDSSGPFAYSIDWGDGSPATTGTARIEVPGPPSFGSFDGSHIYADDGVYDLAVTVIDEQGAETTEVFEVTVSNVLPQLKDVVVTTPISEGGIATLTGTIVDPGAGDTHVLVVAWGDGTTDTFHYGAGTAAFRETYRYRNNQALDAPYIIQLALTDDDAPGHPTTAELPIVVKNMPPTAVDDIYTHIGGGDLVVSAEQGVLANDTDPGEDLITVLAYGAPTVGTLVGNPDGSFVYTPPSADFSGVVRFTYTAVDSDGAVSARAATVTIDSALRGSISGFVTIPFATTSSTFSSIGVPGVTITLTEHATGHVVRTTTLTGDDGSYYFGGLRVGTYTVTETQPAALMPGGTNTHQVVVNADEPRTGVDFVDGWLRNQTISMRNYFASAPPLASLLTPIHIRELIARGEEQAGRAAQAAAIRAGGSQTTVFITGTAGDDTIELAAGPTHHKASVNGYPFVFNASEVESFQIDGLGGRDSISLVGSPSADLAVLRPVPHSSTLQLPDYTLRGSAYLVTITNVEDVTVRGGGGYDRAYLYDSPGNDLLELNGPSARLASWGTNDYSLEVIDFDWVQASGTAGGRNSLHLDGAVDFVFRMEGDWLS